MQINLVELSCRLANERIEELVESNEFTYDEMYEESEAEMMYTKLGQEKFNKYYDYYVTVIKECEIEPKFDGSGFSESDREI